MASYDKKKTTENHLEDFSYLNLSFIDETGSSLSEGESNVTKKEETILQSRDNHVDHVDEIQQDTSSNLEENNGDSWNDFIQRLRDDKQDKTFKTTAVDIELSTLTIHVNFKLEPANKNNSDSQDNERMVSNHSLHAKADEDDAKVSALADNRMTQTCKKLNAKDESEPVEIRHDDSNDEKHQLKRFCTDRVYRAKVIRTVFIMWNFACVGWTMGIIGPTLPDLQLITDSSLQQASWLFAGFNIGYLISCGTSGFELVSMTFAVWQSKSGPVLQLTQFMYGFGGILSPLVAQPFMIKVIRDCQIQNDTSDISKHNDSLTAFGSKTMNKSGIHSMNLTNVCRDITLNQETKETQVQFAYLIGAIFVLSAALPFLIFFVMDNKSENCKSENSQVENNKTVRSKVHMFVIGLICVVSFLGIAVVDAFPSYLASFGLLQLGWTQGFGSSMTALYFAMLAVGSLLGALILKCINVRSFVVLTYILSIVSIILFYFGVHWEIMSLHTVSVVAYGVAPSAIYPTIFTWTQTAVTPVSGVIASAFLFSSSVGCMANPILLGYLIESVDPMWFLYLSILEVVCCFVIFIVAILIIQKSQNKHQN